MKQKKGGGSMQSLIRQANQMQTKMKVLQEELALKEYEGSSGGGAVKVTVKGENEVSNLSISPDIFKEGDIEMLQDMVISAVNDALTTAKTEHEAAMKEITGSMSIPGLF